MRETIVNEYTEKYGELVQLEAEASFVLMWGNILKVLKPTKLPETELKVMAKTGILTHGGNTAGGIHAYELKGVHRAVVATWAKNTSARETDFYEIGKRMNGLMFTQGNVFFTELMGQTIINSLYRKYAPKK
jgi:hypothetical protein